MIIVLEGPDFAGKSTLAHSLEASLPNSRVVHLGQPQLELSLFGHYVQLVMEAAEARDRTTIFDRLHVGEVVYGPRFRGSSRLTVQQLHAIGQLLDELGASKVHVDAPDDVLLSRFRGGRGDDLVDRELDLLAIAAQYREVLGGVSGREAEWSTFGPGDDYLDLLR